MFRARAVGNNRYNTKKHTFTHEIIVVAACMCVDVYFDQGFLERLFDWASEGAVPGKKGQPAKKRDVALICGGTG